MTNTNDLNKTILSPLFWEFDFSSLDFESHSEFIIERVIEKGRMEHLKSLFKIYDEKKIYSCIKDNRNISSAKRHFWNLVEKYE